MQKWIDHKMIIEESHTFNWMKPFTKRSSVPILLPWAWRYLKGLKTTPRADMVWTAFDNELLRTPGCLSHWFWIPFNGSFWTCLSMKMIDWKKLNGHEIGTHVPPWFFSHAKIPPTHLKIGTKVPIRILPDCQIKKDTTTGYGPVPWPLTPPLVKPIFG